MKKKRHTRVPILLLGGLVTVRISLKRGGIDDSLVVHQLVTLVVRTSFQVVLCGVSDDLVGIDDLDLARFLLGVLGFVEDVLSHDGVKKHVQGWSGVVVVGVVVHVFLLLRFIGSQGLKTHGGSPFGARTSAPFVFPFLFFCSRSS